MIKQKILTTLLSAVFMTSVLGAAHAVASEGAVVDHHGDNERCQHAESNYLTANGRQYHYLACGASDKPVMLLLHGFPESSHAWRWQMREFSKGHRVVALDLLGYNLSDKPAEVAAYSVASVAADVVAIIQQLSSAPVTLVGHDWGGTISWAIGAAAPALLNRLVIVNSPHPILFFREYYLNPAQYQASDYIRQIQSGAYDVNFFMADNFAYFRSALFDDPIGKAKEFFNRKTQRQYIGVWSIPNEINSTLNYYRALQFPPAALFTGAVQPWDNPIFNSYHVNNVPVLVIWGNQDIYLVPTINEHLAKFVQNVSVAIEPRNSHWIIHENPKFVNRKIRDFLGSKLN